MKRFSKKGGFTLLELMIVLAIFVIMSAVLVANQKKFGGNVTLDDLAQDVAFGLIILDQQQYTHEASIR